MTIPDDRIITIPVLRESLGLPRERPGGIRDLLAVPRGPGEPVPRANGWRLALGDWPEIWKARPEQGPKFLVMLRGERHRFFIGTVEDIDPSGWAADAGRHPARRQVPVRGTTDATSELAGCQLQADLFFGWHRAEEQFAFL